MTVTTHAATGILVTQWTSNPLIGFTVAILSHYLTDAIPHGDEFLYWRHVHNSKDILAIFSGAVDLFFLIVLFLSVVNFKDGVNTVLIIAATVGSVLPDVLISLYTQHSRSTEKKSRRILTYLPDLYHRFLRFHYQFHMLFHNVVRTPIRFRTGIFYQVLFLIWFMFAFILE